MRLTHVPWRQTICKDYGKTHLVCPCGYNAIHNGDSQICLKVTTFGRIIRGLLRQLIE